MALAGAAPSPTQDLGRRGGEVGHTPTPTPRPTPAGRQGSGPQPLPPSSQGAPTAQFTLPSLCNWVGSGMELDNRQRQRGWKAWLPYSQNTYRHTHMHAHTQVCSAEQPQAECQMSLSLKET